MSMKLGKLGKDLILHFEGLHDLRSDGKVQAYIDPVGVPTIGYGTTYYKDSTDRVKLGDVKTKEECAELFRWQIQDIYGAAVNRVVKVPINQEMYDALTSFCYNAGVGALTDSTLLRLLNSGDYAGAAKQFKRWNKGTVRGVLTVLPGLTRRRKMEEKLFRKGGLTPSGKTPDQVSEETYRPSPDWFVLTSYALYSMTKKNEPIQEIQKTKSKTPINTAAFVGKNLVLDMEKGKLELAKFEKKEEPKKVENPIVGVPYFSQYSYGNASARGNTICGCTSVAMVASYFGVKKNPDDVLADYGKAKCQSPNGVESALDGYGLWAVHTYSGTMDDIERAIESGSPVIVHGYFTAGHILVVIGVTDTEVICNDPAGVWNQRYRGSYGATTGKGIRYNRKAFEQAVTREIWMTHIQK